MKRTRRHHQHDPEMDAVYSRRRFLVASAAATVPLTAWWTLGSPSEASDSEASDAGEPTETEAGGAQAPQPTTIPTTTRGLSTSPSTSTVPVLDHVLVEGVVDSKIGIMQQRLADLAFDPGPVDDYYGSATIRSVWAFKKLVMGIPREQADGDVTPEVWERLHESVDIAPRRNPGGTHVEIYLPEQVAVLYENGKARVVSHVSSGEGVEWCAEVEIDLDDGTTEKKGICGLSITPGGVYHFERKVEGWRNAKLGRLYKPTYFNYGIAIHGASNVPNYPASRGCVRFPMHIAEYIQDLVDIGDAVYVFDGVEDPETYGAAPMRFDWPDPEYTTTTTSTTTTTTPPTTTPPTTSAPEAAATTTHPHSTTSTTTPATSTSTTSTTVPPTIVTSTTASPG